MITHQPHTVRVRHRLWCVFRDTLDLTESETARVFGVDRCSIRRAYEKHARRLVAA